MRLISWPTAALVAACASQPAHRAVTAHTVHRIVSLMPSLTEDLCAIGAGRALVGTDRFSRDVACARHLPTVADFASVDAERIVALHPDVVVGIPAQAGLTAPLRRAGILTRLYADDSYEDIFTDLAALGTLTGHDAAARSLAVRLRAQTARLRAGERFARAPRVFVALGTGPIWTVGPSSYIATLLRYAGSRDAARLHDAYGTYSAEALLRAQPDAIVADPNIHIERVLDREPWRSLRAIRERRVFVIDAPDTVMRPGPRYNEGIRWLIERLRPVANAR